MDDDRLLEVPRPDVSPSAGATNPDTADTSMADEPALDLESQRVAMLVREIELPPEEVAAAKDRVRARVLAAIGSDDTPVPVPTPRAQRPRPSPRRLAGIAAAAAIILLSVSTGIGLSSAAAGALPSSPLYGLKRAEEWVALHTAWSDQRRGEVLVGIAQHRLAEVSAESSLGHAASATALSGELKDTVLQIIHLTADMSRQHEDIRVVSAGLVGILAAESSAQATAAQAGDVQLAQALQQARTDEAQAITNLNVQLPAGAPGPTDVPGWTPSAGGASQTPGPPGQGTGPTPLATPRATPTGQPTPTRGADGDGHDGTGSGGHGKPTPTPTGTGGTGHGDGGNGGNGGNSGNGSGGNGTGGHPYVAVAGDGAPPTNLVSSPPPAPSGSHKAGNAAGAPQATHAASGAAAQAPKTTSTRGHAAQPTSASKPHAQPAGANSAVPSAAPGSRALATPGGAGTSARPSATAGDAHGSGGSGRKAKP